jgi:hypothetical protein
MYGPGNALQKYIMDIFQKLYFLLRNKVLLNYILHNIIL